MGRYKRKKGLPSSALWRRWQKSDTYKALIDAAKALMDNPIFRYELLELKKNHPPYVDPLFKKWPWPVLVYPGQWEEFAEKWRIDYDSLIKGEIKVFPAIRIVAELGNPIRLKRVVASGTDPKEITLTEFSHYDFLYYMAHTDLYGRPSNRSGRKPETAKHKRWRTEYIRRRKKGEKSVDIIEDIARRDHAAYDTVRYRVGRKTGGNKKFD